MNSYFRKVNYIITEHINVGDKIDDNDSTMTMLRGLS